MNLQVGDLVRNVEREAEIGLVVDITDTRIYIEWNDGDLCWYSESESWQIFHKIS